jgi:hypothetical protein
MGERKGVLVTLGEEDGVRSPLLKIWDLEKVDKKLGLSTPVLLRSVKVQTSNRPHPVSLYVAAYSILDKRPMSRYPRWPFQTHCRTSLLV